MHFGGSESEPCMDQELLIMFGVITDYNFIIFFYSFTYP